MRGPPQERAVGLWREPEALLGSAAQWQREPPEPVDVPAMLLLPGQMTGRTGIHLAMWSGQLAPPKAPEERHSVCSRDRRQEISEWGYWAALRRLQ